MDTGFHRQEQHLPLRVAAALLHIRVVGKVPDATNPGRMRETLDDVARALSMVAPIYAHDEASGMPAKIPEAILMGASFSQGATLIIVANGIQYEGLTVKRADLEMAGEILRASKGVQERWTTGD